MKSKCRHFRATSKKSWPFSYQWCRHRVGCSSYWIVGPTLYLLSKFLPDFSESCHKPVKRASDQKNPQGIFVLSFDATCAVGSIGGHYLVSGEIFTLQKKIIKIMTGAQHRTPCRDLRVLQQLESLHFM